MNFLDTTLHTARLIELAPRGDERGWFARSYCERAFGEAGLPTHWVQQNVSLTRQKGSLRGMHFQRPPAAEDKLVRCLSGAIVDVIIDLRPDSPTYLRHEAFELTADNFRQLWVPKGFAHGFQALTDDVAVTYLVSEFYTPEAEGGVRFDDPLFAIDWPLPVADISAKDAAWPLQDANHPIALTVDAGAQVQMA